jgi:TonB family protein
MASLSATIWSALAASQSIEPSRSSTAEHTHPRLDPKHLWHLDLPSKLMSQGQSGTCLIHFQVDPDGGIRVAQVVRSTGFPQLDQACVQNILRQTLLPGTDHGVSITEWVTWPISMNAPTPPTSDRDTSQVPQIQQFSEVKASLAAYPTIAHQVHTYKDCTVRIWVAADATVDKIEVVQSSGIEMLDQACQAAVKAAQFTAARQDGATVGGWAEITMRWKIS